MLNNILLLIGITLMYSTPLVFGALGGVISERSGVVNIGIEGMMTIGALTGAAVSYATGNPWLGFLCAGLGGGAFATLHALAAVTFKADQNVSGIALNLLGPGIALFIARLIWNGGTQSPSIATLPKLFGKGAFADTPWANLNVDITVVLGIIICALVWFVLYHTALGLRVRAVGEHPGAADTLGINVSRVRFACVVLSGVMAGFGGASITLAIISQFTQTAVAGQGFIALAAVIFGKWTPHGSYAACLLFGLAQALVIILGGGVVPIPSEILACLPYVLTLFILILFVGKSVAPAADGIPYEKGVR
ncbi:ABC transporter permease [Collinsella sp. zg1085]|uniref:ABC transporter permease n=1 Tax=Collinsella sp. zg1085 TaxID=2844380 RepID=UPI001C0BED02|nr:ABC transporter permease [Collinsella sp. zg1085]QWT17399.1 ABC transporter permease [Collinsella sp. zg1085]